MHRCFATSTNAQGHHCSTFCQCPLEIVFQVLPKLIKARWAWWCIEFFRCDWIPLAHDHNPSPSQPNQVVSPTAKAPLVASTSSSGDGLAVEVELFWIGQNSYARYLHSVLLWKSCDLRFLDVNPTTSVLISSAYDSKCHHPIDNRQNFQIPRIPILVSQHRLAHFYRYWHPLQTPTPSAFADLSKVSQSIPLRLWCSTVMQT